MKLNRKALRSMILKEIKNLTEATVLSPGSIKSLYGDPLAWGKKSQWDFVLPSSIQQDFIKHNQSYGTSPRVYFDQVRKDGMEFQLQKVGTALAALTSTDPEEQSSIDDLYRQTFDDYGSRTYVTDPTPGGIQLPKLPKGGMPLDDDEFDFDDDDDDDVYPGPLVP